jgi:hypothetical protein
VAAKPQIVAANKMDARGRPRTAVKRSNGTVKKQKLPFSPISERDLVMAWTSPRSRVEEIARTRHRTDRIPGPDPGSRIPRPRIPIIPKQPI